ncbi:MAG: glycosyltransferase [Acidobacteriota bacterium]
MRVLQIVAADRWTGAAATALQLAEALRGADVDCDIAFRPGNNLAERLAGVPWCHPLLAKERSLAGVRRAIAIVRKLAAGCDVVHAHLPHDHALARLALAVPPPALVRSIHHPRHLRRDPFQRWLMGETVALGLTNSTMAPAARRTGGRPFAVLPIALEERFLAVATAPTSRRAGIRASRRAALGVPADAIVAGSVGKLDCGRSQDLLLHALAAAPGIWGLVIGHGPKDEALRRLARRLGVAERVAWTGYVDDGLEEHYLAMDLFVFPAAGSDWAHRALAEAAACGVPALAADLAGVRDLVEPGATGDIFPAEDAAALAVLLRRWSTDPALRERAGAAAAARAIREWTPARLAAAALDLYRQVL